MNDTVHGHMVQDLLRHRFGSHDNLICKYSSKYPVQAEREFQRLTNAYIRILNELLKEYLPEIRDAARAEREAGQRHDDASDLIAKVRHKDRRPGKGRCSRSLTDLLFCNEGSRHHRPQSG